MIPYDKRYLDDHLYLITAVNSSERSVLQVVMSSLPRLQHCDCLFPASWQEKYGDHLNCNPKHHWWTRNSREIPQRPSEQKLPYNLCIKKCMLQKCFFILTYTTSQKKNGERERESERMSAMIEIKKKLLAGFNPIWKILISQNGFIFPNFRGVNMFFLIKKICCESHTPL